jgi:multidrug transporter EmrE-like cation transporter
MSPEAWSGTVLILVASLLMVRATGWPMAAVGLLVIIVGVVLLRKAAKKKHG